MLEFHYDFMTRFVDQRDIEYCEMDKDSACIAFSNAHWLMLLKPGPREQYLERRHSAHSSDIYEPDTDFNWFPRDCCEEHAKYDRRTPGLFPIE